MRSDRISRSLSVVSPAGIYYNAKKMRKRKIGSDKAQREWLQAVLVTDKGCLPPLSNTAWHQNIITALSDLSIPSFAATIPTEKKVLCKRQAMR